MGATEEPSEPQLAALHEKTYLLKGLPYADFAIFTPFGRRCLKAQKFRVYVPLGDGSFMMHHAVATLLGTHLSSRGQGEG